jgi:outer membrane receptor protein involved in Fe transport
LSAQFISGQIISIDEIISLSGKVVDSNTKQPLEYATVSFLKRGQDEIIGTTTDINGIFKIDIEAGIYDIKIDFLSFESYKLKSKILTKDLDLGTIILNIDNKLDEVEVVADKQLMEFKINKRIYNASADIVNKGGNALDVLSNTPSVRVDIEGNISVRASRATILINGKPQFNIDNNADILKSMPSNSIDKVEIITRSAKYSAQGSGAILNIITKKKKNSGFSGSFEAHTGTPDNHGFSTFLNKKTGNVNLYTTISYINENRIKLTDVDQPLLNLSQDINQDRLRNSYLLNLGSDFYLSDNSTLSTAFLVNSNNKNNNFEITENDFARNTKDFDDILKVEASIGYAVKLDSIGQKLSVDFKYETTDSETNDHIVEQPTNVASTDILQQSNKDQQLDNFLAQLDYTLPFNKNKNIELGYRGTLRNYKNIYKVEEFDESISAFAVINDLDDIFEYKESIHAFYATYNATHDKFSYSIGLRSEISDVNIKEENKDVNNSKKYTDLFPSLTIAYEINDDSFLSLNYNRSIDRPTVPQINPFISFADQRFQSIGNQNLNPFYTNYLEILFDQRFKKVSIATSFFLNYQKDHLLPVIQNTGLLANNGDEIFRRININSGDFNIIGIDLDITYKPFKGLRLNGYLSPYKQEITKALDPNYNSKNTVLYAEGNVLITLPEDLKLSFAHVYQSAMEYSITKLNAVNFSNITISKDLLKKNATLTFKAIDIFKSKRFLYESIEADTQTFYDAYYKNQFILSFTYRFNQKSINKKDRSKDINKDDLEDKQDKKM